MPIPGNAEFAVFFLIWVVLAIIWAASDAVNAGLFATLTTVLTFGYLISRGIAKASRVLEHSGLYRATAGSNLSFASRRPSGIRVG